jgi:uncharacterized protein YjiS (DUF1127 family)
MADVSVTSRQASVFVERLGAWFAEWRRTAREVRSQAELTRKLRGVDDHLLRDMGLERTERRFERILGDDSSWR